MITKSSIRLGIKVIFLGTFFVLVFAARVMALDVTAKTCSQSDVQSAITQVQSAGGGTVYIPAGNCTWTDSSGIDIEIDGSLSIIGAGIGKTIITKTNAGSSNIFLINNAGTPHMMPFFRLSEMTLIGSQTSGCGEWSSMIQLMSAKEFRLDHLYMKHRFCNLVEWKNARRGVVDNCKFVQDTGTDVNCNSSMAYGLTPGSCYSPYTGKWDSIPNRACDVSVCDCRIGSRSVKRTSSVAAGNTVVAKLELSSSGAAIINNRGGSGTGKIQRVYIYITSIGAMPKIDLATFSASGNYLTSRGVAAGIPVHVGLNIFEGGVDFTPFNVSSGDYLGVYLNNCTLASGSSYDGQDSGTAASATWVVSGNQTARSNILFTLQSNNISLWGEIYDTEGALMTCETNWEGWWNGRGTYGTDPNMYRGGRYYTRILDNSWKPTSSDNDAIFMEDNYFQWWYAAIEGNWASLHRLVARNNYFVLPTPYGNCKLNASRITMKPAAAGSQVYNNVFDYYSVSAKDISFDGPNKQINMGGDVNGFRTFTDMFVVGNQIDIKGTVNNNKTVTLTNVSPLQLTVSEILTTEAAGNMVILNKHGISPTKTAIYAYSNFLIYNNVFNNFYYIAMPSVVERDYGDWTLTPTARTHHIYIWGNTLNNVACGATETVACTAAYQSAIANGWVGEGQNLFFRAPVSGEAMYGFGEYTYPHPLRYTNAPNPPKGLRIVPQ